MSTVSSIKLTFNFQGIDFSRGVKLIEIIGSDGNNLISDDIEVSSKDELFQQLAMILAAVDLDTIAHHTAGGNQLTSYDKQAQPFLSCLTIEMSDTSQQFMVINDGRLPVAVTDDVDSYSDIINTVNSNVALVRLDIQFEDRIKLSVDNKVLFYGNMYDTGLDIEENPDEDYVPMIKIDGDYYDFKSLDDIDTILNAMSQTAIATWAVESGVLKLNTTGYTVNSIVLTHGPGYEI